MLRQENNWRPRPRKLSEFPADTQDARRLTFLMGGTYHKLEWLRMVGDVVFLLAGALPITLGALRSVWKRDLSPTA